MGAVASGIKHLFGGVLHAAESIGKEAAHVVEHLGKKAVQTITNPAELAKIAANPALITDDLCQYATQEAGKTVAHIAGKLGIPAVGQVFQSGANAIASIGGTVISMTDKLGQQLQQQCTNGTVDGIADVLKQIGVKNGCKLSSVLDFATSALENPEVEAAIRMADGKAVTQSDTKSCPVNISYHPIVTKWCDSAENRMFGILFIMVRFYATISPDVVLTPKKDVKTAIMFVGAHRNPHEAVGENLLWALLTAVPCRAPKLRAQLRDYWAARSNGVYDLRVGFLDSDKQLSICNCVVGREVPQTWSIWIEESNHEVYVREKNHPDADGPHGRKVPMLEYMEMCHEALSGGSHYDLTVDHTMRSLAVLVINIMTSKDTANKALHLPQLNAKETAVADALITTTVHSLGVQGNAIKFFSETAVVSVAYLMQNPREYPTPTIPADPHPRQVRKAKKSQKKKGKRS